MFRSRLLGIPRISKQMEDRTHLEVFSAVSAAHFSPGDTHPDPDGTTYLPQLPGPPHMRVQVWSHPRPYTREEKATSCPCRSITPYP